MNDEDFAYNYGRDRLVSLERRERVIPDTDIIDRYWWIRGRTDRTDHEYPDRSLPDRQWVWAAYTPDVIHWLYNCWAAQTAYYSSTTDTVDNDFFRALVRMGSEILPDLVNIMIDPDRYVSHPFMVMREFMDQPPHIPYEEHGRIPMIEQRYLNEMIRLGVVKRSDLNPNHLTTFEMRNREYVESVGLVFQPSHD